MIASTASGSSMGPALLVRSSFTGGSLAPSSWLVRAPTTLARAKKGSSLPVPESSSESDSLP